MKQRQVQGNNNLFILAGLMLLLIFWSLSLLFLISGIAASDTAICVIVVFGVPALVAILAVRTRRKINDQRAHDSYMQIKGRIDICDEQKGDEEPSE